MNNFSVLHSIDDIFDRLTAVAPSWDARDDGPTQWLYICEPLNSFEFELVQQTTVLSAPTFPSRDRRLRSGMFVHWDTGILSKDPSPATDVSGLPLPTPRKGQVAYSVDFHLLQSLSGLRAVLLVLMDSCELCALTPDYVGLLPASDSLSVVSIMKTWSVLDFVPNAKYWKDWPLAFFLDNPLPPVPPSWTLSPTAPLFTGETGRYWRRLAGFPTNRPESSSFYRALFGLAQSKRGFAAVPRIFVKRQMSKHARQLSTPPVSDPDLESARIFARSLFSGFTCPSILKSLPTLEASTKASVENSRENGGAREHLRLLSAKLQGVDANGDTFISMREHSPGQVIEDRGLPPLSPSQWLELVSGYTPQTSASFLPKRTQEAIAEFLSSGDPGRKAPEESTGATGSGSSSPDLSSLTLPVARVAEVLEPLKVRLITAMDAVRTHAARPLQGALWRYLSSLDIFTLIGSPISESVIHDLVISDEAYYGKRTADFVSGDYSAATDGLDIRLSKVILEVILETIHTDDLPLVPFLREVLLEQIIVYPPWTGITPIRQANGQLMGSVLSFPVLCVANLFAYTMSHPDWKRIIRSKKEIIRLPVRVNGDDILFRTDDSFYQSWIHQTSKVGFQLSVGKNFRHPRFFTVNSVPLEYSPPIVPKDPSFAGWSWADIEEYQSPPEVPYQVSLHGFLNVGLLTGQAKYTGRAELSSIPISGWHRGSVMGSLNPRQSHGWFLHYHEHEVKSQTRFGSETLNIFAHPLLGGLGFDVPSGVEPRFSPSQRRIAHALFLSAQGTFTGREKDFSLAALLYLEGGTPGMSLLGRRMNRVEVQLYPFGSPLPEGYQVFEDRSGIHPLVLSTPMAMDEGEISRPKCRLSGTQIRKLTRQYGQTISLHPVDKMRDFPYIPVRVVTSFTDGVSDPKRVPVYVPMDHFVEESQQDSGLQTSTIKEVPLEDWETQDVGLFLPLVPDPPVLERQTAVSRPRRPTQLQIITQNNLNVCIPPPHLRNPPREERSFDYKYSRKGSSGRSRR